MDEKDPSEILGSSTSDPMSNSPRSGDEVDDELGNEVDEEVGDEIDDEIDEEPGGEYEDTGAIPAVRPRRVSGAGAVIALLLGLLGFALVVQLRSNATDPGLPVLVRHRRTYARKRCRRIAATLPKIRTPSTTTTPVDNCPPTPNWSPR